METGERSVDLVAQSARPPCVCVEAENMTDFKKNVLSRYLLFRIRHQYVAQAALEFWLECPLTSVLCVCLLGLWT